MTNILPSLEGTSLSGRPIRFPEDLPESGLVLVLGFTHAARHDVGAWKKALTERNIPFLSLPAAARDTSAESMAGVAQAMRDHVPAVAWEQVVQIHRGGEALLRQFHWQANDFAKLLRVRRDGHVISSHGEGPFDPDSFAAFAG